MASPFPGMNPYLERESVWHDFHEGFLPVLREALVPQVRPDFIVTLDQHVYIHEPPTESPWILGRGDVAVSQTGDVSEIKSAGISLRAPVQVRIPMIVDFEKQSFVEIRDREDRSLVTVIEMLSPINKKTGSDREQFLAKRRRYFKSEANYVEIDLLRGGPRLPLEEMPDCDYYVLVSRVEERPQVGMWPLRLREPLPVIPIPLRPPRPDAQLDLQAILHRVYDAAGYADYIYGGKPTPRLHPDDDAWVQQFLSPAS